MFLLSLTKVNGYLQVESKQLALPWPTQVRTFLLSLTKESILTKKQSQPPITKDLKLSRFVLHLEGYSDARDPDRKHKRPHNVIGKKRGLAAVESLLSLTKEDVPSAKKNSSQA